MPSPDRIAVITHGKVAQIGDALQRLVAQAERAGVEVLLSEDERAKHGIEGQGDDIGRADLAVVLGGDGTMLRALDQFLDSGLPVLGINYGRVGFLTSIPAAELEQGLARMFAGELEVVDLPTLEVDAGGERRAAINDVVATSASLGRIVELEWALGGDDLGLQPCDGLICAAPAGSTAYNLSNGGPVLVWGVDAMAITFVAPQSLRARPLVVPRGRRLVVRNVTPDVSVAVLADGHRFADLEAGGTLSVELGERRSRLAVLPGTTFFKRYSEAFAH